MATQGLVSIVDDQDNVLFKVVAGCNGYNVPKFIKAISKPSFKISAINLYKKAQAVDLGCPDCLVVIDKDTDIIYNGDREELTELYTTTFNDPEFNPRWKLGTSDYSCIKRVAVK